MAVRATSPEQQYDQALALHRGGRLEQAAAAYRALLEVEPSHAGALQLLGVIEGQCGRFVQAAELIEQAIRIEPDNAAAHANLGNTLHARGRHEQALASYQRALTLQPTNRAALMGQGKTCWSLGRLSDALESYDLALAFDRNNTEALMNRGDILLTLGRRAEALASLQRAIDCGADAERIRFVLASVGVEPTPGTAPQAYVKDLFDHYADRFDEALVDQLGYQAPALMVELIRRHVGADRLNVLDLGCGTGLCGPLLRPLAGWLTGVDLSDSMLAKARERGVYDRLESTEISAWLVQCRAEYDLITSTDVFIYIGDLAPVFAGARCALRAGGLFVFSVEASEGPDYELPPTRRYRHSRGYIERLAGEHGFVVEALEAIVVRRNEGADVKGDLALLRRRDAA